MNVEPVAGDQPDLINIIDSETGSMAREFTRQAVSQKLLDLFLKIIIHLRYCRNLWVYRRPKKCSYREDHHHLTHLASLMMIL